MGKMMGKEATVVQGTNSGFEFTGTPVDKLGASEYTIVNVLVDMSGSIGGWERQVEDCLKTIVNACRKSPRAENLLLRVVGFNTNTSEIHGFVELMNIDVKDYDNKIHANGGTALLDALLNAVESTGDYAKDLNDRDIFCNAIVFCITDGDDNSSRIATINGRNGEKIAQVVEKLRTSELLESIKTILIGICDPSTMRGNEVTPMLDRIKKGANIDEYVLIGNMNKGTLAKLAGFVSHSISSTSQALNTGGPSKPIDPNAVPSIDLTTV
jgi:uncharacterized protein YegL